MNLKEGQKLRFRSATLRRYGLSGQSDWVITEIDGEKVRVQSLTDESWTWIGPGTLGGPIWEQPDGEGWSILDPDEPTPL